MPQTYSGVRASLRKIPMGHMVSVHRDPVDHGHRSRRDLHGMTHMDDAVTFADRTTSGHQTGTTPTTLDDPWIVAISSIQHVSVARFLYATVIKRLIDVLASAILLLLLSPVMLAALVAIRLDSPGSAIFTQDRVGRGGKIFRLYKFRTMSYDASGKIAWIVDADGKKRHKVRNDPRVTRVGRWLRLTSLDELPQLVNIIKGDMSLIGPRPELVEIVRNYEEWQHQRHIVRPGLTGWWQVSGRGDKPMHENTELDLFYVRGQSFRLDFLIALKTVRVVLRGLGAF